VDYYACSSLYSEAHFMAANECLFCKIVVGDVPADILYQDDEVLAFHDINPQAPIHILVVPKQHLDSLASVADENRNLMGHIMLTAKEIAKDEGLSHSGYRTVINVGADGGQTVNHLHLHLLGGRALRWPPG
jgi:histidine triad (HIT) family protein|tara:strand:- start:322 stop:717 length:396 start_codon:yes stop_codon:yes gene_type:complete